MAMTRLSVLIRSGLAATAKLFDKYLDLMKDSLTSRLLLLVGFTATPLGSCSDATTSSCSDDDSCASHMLFAKLLPTALSRAR